MTNGTQKPLEGDWDETTADQIDQGEIQRGKRDVVWRFVAGGAVGVAIRVVEGVGEVVAAASGSLSLACDHQGGGGGVIAWIASAVCACWIQCGTWQKKRSLVRPRWRYEGEMIWNYASVMRDLTEGDVSHLLQDGRCFAHAL